MDLTSLMADLLKSIVDDILFIKGIELMEIDQNLLQLILLDRIEYHKVSMKYTVVDYLVCTTQFWFFVTKNIKSRDIGIFCFLVIFFFFTIPLTFASIYFSFSII